jgi:hypothetical protein
MTPDGISNSVVSEQIEVSRNMNDPPLITIYHERVPGAAENSPAKQLNTFLDRFDPPIQTLVRQARAKLRRRMPTAIELVYDNYNALAIGFASSERKSDAIVSLAVYARGVNLYFIYGAALADPHHVLLGSGNQGRFVRLESAAMLDRPEIEQLLTAAIAEGDTPLPRSGKGRLVIKSVSPRQRPRRPSAGLAAARR